MMIFILQNNFGPNEEIIDGETEIKLYDFKNIHSKEYIKQISSQNKIDDCVLWTLFSFREPQTDWNLDGGHPGVKGHKLIFKVLHQNIIEKLDMKYIINTGCSYGVMFRSMKEFTKGNDSIFK